MSVMNMYLTKDWAATSVLIIITAQYYLSIDIPKGRRSKQIFVSDLNKCLVLLFTKTSLA